MFSDVTLNNTDLIIKSEEMIKFLKHYSDEYNDNIDNLKIELEETNYLIKELEFKEEILLNENINIFSPNCTIENEINKINLEKKRLQNKLDELTLSKNELINKRNNLILSAKCIEQLKEDSQKKNSKEEKESDIRNSEIGINIIWAQERERQRIAMDLHDCTVQNLTSLVHKTELCFKLIDIDVIRAKLELNTMGNTIKSIINDMRDIIYNLKPMSLEDLGLVDTVERYIKQLMVTHDIKFILNYNEEIEVLPIIKLSLFRIIQEACNNVIKHTKATKVDIDVNFKPSTIKITIKDNGNGFIHEDVEVNESKSSKFGLTIMKERVKFLSGDFQLKSEKGRGTKITVIVPLTF